MWMRISKLGPEVANAGEQKGCNFIKNRLQHRFFPVKIAKILRTPILKNIWEWLVLQVFDLWNYCLKSFKWQHMLLNIELSENSFVSQAEKFQEIEA